MTAIGEIRGPSPLRWCGCGEHILELTGTYYFNPGGDSLDEPEYGHTPLCAVCQDKERLRVRDTARGRLGSIRWWAPKASPRVAEGELRPS